MPTELTEPVRPILNQRYRVLDLLGQGATSVVLKVEDLQAEGNIRAIKLLQHGASEPLLRAEFERLSRMAHPNLVQVHDLGRLRHEVQLAGLEVEAGRLFLAMDHVAGTSPRELLQRAPGSEREALLRGIARDLAHALDHVHGHGLVHHDVKPDNVLLDGQGRAVLLDLGLATLQRRTRLAGRGTLPYMAPEGLVGGGDHRVDLYGMGATLYHLAAGRPPFAGQGARLAQRILEDPPRLPGLPWLGQEMAALLLRLLEKDPLNRPGSARVVLSELARMEGDHEAVAELVARPALMPPAFVGRREELGRLLQLLDGGGVVLVLGEPGAGKTRLVDEALRRRRIDEAVGRRPRREVLAGNARELLRRGAPTTVASIDDVVLRWLESLEQRDEAPPVIRLTLEGDADPLVRRLLEMLLSGDEQLPAPLVVLEALLDSPVVEGLQGPGRHRIELGPLSRAETRQLAASMLATADVPAQRIHRLARGNPSLSVELIRLFHEQGDSGLDLKRVGTLDALVVRGRSRLSPREQQVVDALAVWGAPATVGELARLSGLTEDEVWDAVEVLARRRSVLVTDRISLPGTAHVSAWRKTVDPERAHLLHGRAARLLEGEQEREALLPRLAEHRLAAGLPGAERTALEAAWALERAGAAASAIPLLRQVVQVGAEESRDAVPQLARLLMGTGQYDDALDLLPEEEHPLLRAEILQKRGDYQQAEGVLRELVPRLEGTERVKAAALLSRLMLGQGRPAEALEVTRAQDSDDPALLEATGLAHVYLGHLEQADRIFSRGEAVTREDPGRLARMLSFRGMVALSGGRSAQAAEHYRRALELSEEVGDVHGRATYLANLGAIQLQRGCLADALVHLTRVVRDLARLARTTELASALCNLSNLLLLLGELGPAGEHLERASAEAERLDSRRTAGFVAMLEGDLARRRGDHLGAVEAYRRAEVIFTRGGASRELVDCRLSLCWALVGAEQGEECAALLRGLWSAHPDRRGEVAVGWARLLASPAAPPRVRGPRNLEQELSRHCAVLESQGSRVELWRAATTLGRWLAGGGRIESARAVLGRARDRWEEIVKESPEVYREGMNDDPDATALYAQWAALLDESQPGAESPASAPASRSGVVYDRRWIRRVLTINKRLNSELRLPRLLELILDTAIELTEAERGFLLLQEEQGLAIKVARNIDQHSLEGEELSLSRSIAEQAARSGQPVVAIDAAEDQRFQEAMSVSDLNLRSVLAVPLNLKGRAVGTIYVDHRARQGVFGEAEAELMQDIAEQAAIAIDNARLLAENRRKAEEIERLNQQLLRKVDSQQEELEQVREELRSSRQALKLRYDYGNIIGRTPRMLELFRLLDRVTETHLPVVIQGESGTGKELVARAIHENGPRTDKPFVGENCGAIPETLLESILFGHVKGAFTGAERDRKGLFEVASGGTLFLDEVGEMSPAMQTKLLRVLQDGELRRVGGTQTVSTDVRVIAASNRDLSGLVAEGKFREDLFYRLNVIQIEIPPLRQRREDIPLLVEHFMGKHSSTPDRRVSPEAMGLLMGYPWPGNVRELENEIMRAAALGGEVIEHSDLSPQIAAAVPLALSDPDDLDLRTRVEHLERELIQRALRRTGNNNTRSAKLLGLSRYGLLKKLQRYGMNDAGAK